MHYKNITIFMKRASRLKQYDNVHAVGDQFPAATCIIHFILHVVVDIIFNVMYL